MADLPLAIDEVHRLAGHVRLQRELLGILRRRKPLRSPTLLISRWHPREIRRFDATLCSHLLSGFLIRLDYPGPDARLRYLRALEGSASRNGRGPVIMSLARDVRGSFTDLRRVWAAGREGLDRCPGYLFFADPRALFTRLCEQVAQRFEVQSEEIIGRKQTRHISQARQVLCQLCVNKGFNRAEIGRFLGGRSRAAVSHAIKALQRRMSATPVLRALVESLQ